MTTESQICKFITSECRFDEMGSLCDWVGSILEKKIWFFFLSSGLLLISSFGIRTWLRYSKLNRYSINENKLKWPKEGSPLL